MKNFVHVVCISVAAAITSTAFVSVPVYATTPEAVRTAEVGFGDLNLRTEAGQERILARVRSAARQVCGQSSNNRDLIGAMRQKSCVQEAVTRARVQIAMQTLAASDKQRLAAAPVETPRH